MAEEKTETPTPTREEWIARCVARLRSVCCNIPEDYATQTAEAQLENLNGDLTESPEDAADEEISAWGE